MLPTPEYILSALLRDCPALQPCAEDIHKTYACIRGVFAAGGKLLLCGNGGSAADCDHIAGELMKGFLRKRSVPDAFKAHPALNGEGEKLQCALPAIALTTHTALITAIANDNGAEMIYAQQVYGYGKPGDALLAISTSGNADNVCRALRVARAVGLTAIGLSGRGGGKMADLCDAIICVPEEETYRIQEMHLPVYHALCAMWEAYFFMS